MVTSSTKRRDHRARSPRWRFIQVAFGLVAVIIVVRLWQLQVLGHEVYARLAVDQQAAYELLIPKRGNIYATERSAAGGTDLVPLAVNRDAYYVYAEPVRISDPQATADALAPILKRDAAELLPILNKPNDPFEPLLRRAGREVAEALWNAQMDGIGIVTERQRFYPYNTIGSHVLGFVSYRDDTLIGQYGVEGALDAALAGESGSVRSESNAAGVWIALGDRDLKAAVDGSDVVLTIDWTVQFHACQALNEWVARHGASGGSLIVLDPDTGAVIAMCGAPDYNPNVYNETKRITSFNNPAVFLDYEPGSIMKPITMAAALDQQRVTPRTTYVDEGVVQVGTHTIRNSDKKAHGEQTMTDVLKESLNTGAIYAMRTVGGAIFRKYLEDFGFGTVTGINLAGEATGDIRRLYETNEIYPLTASFGQGLTATPLQMVNAFAAIANGGNLMQPYLVAEVRRPNGETEIREPKTIRRVISQKTAAQLAGMLVTVVEEGHGKRAGVSGYYIAGKTGTAQIPRRDGRGYEQGATIGSFVGFGPVSNPRFAMIVRIDRPQTVRFAESSAAPLFGEIAQFILQYYEVPPDRRP